MDSDIETFRVGRFTAHLIQDGLFKIPAETLLRLGKAKKAGRSSNARLLLGLTCMALQDGDKVIIVDTGLGDKPLGDVATEYEVELPRKLIPSLKTLGITPTDVDLVILSHLHWDHAGGSTTLDQKGEAVPAFPNARNIIQEWEWEWAMSPEGQANDGYIPDDYVPLQDAGQLRLVKGDEEVYPGIQVEWTGGHCPGHQVVWVEDGGDTLLFPADMIPTPQFLTLDRVLSYDHAPNDLVASKQELIRRAVDFQAVVVFQHVPRRRTGVLYRNPEGEILLEQRKDGT
jgi:glyoxylase-like metal-dependent hydrolase (beta-lactamase superfamily II)